MAELTIYVPSFGRPKAPVGMWRAFSETCTSDTELVIICNDNDPNLDKYRRCASGLGRVLVVPGGRRGMCDSLTQGLECERANGFDGFAVGFMGDDHLPRSYGWDSAYLQVLNRLGTGIVYGNDLFQGERIPTQVAMTYNIVRRLGYMVPPALQHLFVDNVWRDWGIGIDRLVYLDYIVVEHNHPLAGKGVNDHNYKAVNSDAVANADLAAYNAYVADGMDADIDKLKELL